jgi:hypothetical protein
MGLHETRRNSDCGPAGRHIAENNRVSPNTCTIANYNLSENLCACPNVYS